MICTSSTIDYTLYSIEYPTKLEWIRNRNGPCATFRLVLPVRTDIYIFFASGITFLHYYLGSITELGCCHLSRFGYNISIESNKFMELF